MKRHFEVKYVKKNGIATTYDLWQTTKMTKRQLNSIKQELKKDGDIFVSYREIKQLQN